MMNSFSQGVSARCMTIISRYSCLVSPSSPIVSDSSHVRERWDLQIVYRKNQYRRPRQRCPWRTTIQRRWIRWSWRTKTPWTQALVEIRLQVPHFGCHIHIKLCQHHQFGTTYSSRWIIYIRLIEIMPRQSTNLETLSSRLITLIRAARLRGFETDLNLKGQDFNTLLSILYVGYILMQIPSWVIGISLSWYWDWRIARNLFLNQIGRPSLYLPLCMMVWGAISILTGARLRRALFIWRDLDTAYRHNKKVSIQHMDTNSTFYFSYM